MTSVLRNLQAEWNTLVPEARARGVRRVRLLNAPLETIAYRRAKLEWLRSQLGRSGSFDSLTFGVEIECILPRGVTKADMARFVREAGVECNEEMYNHTRRGSWKIVTDGSLGDYVNGCELVSPVLQGEAGFEQLRKVCAVLTAKGATINRRCGFHVHVGAASESISFFKNLVRLYASAEDAIDAMVAPSRRQSVNPFCGSLKARVRAGDLGSAETVAQVARAIGQHYTAAYARSNRRYCKLNLQSFWQHGTVEFRQHQGTVEAAKAENWVRLCLRMCLTARAGEKTVSTLEDLLTAVEASQTEREFFTSRVLYFQRRAA